VFVLFGVDGDEIIEMRKKEKLQSSFSWRSVFVEKREKDKILSLLSFLFRFFHSYRWSETKRPSKASRDIKL